MGVAHLDCFHCLCLQSGPKASLYLTLVGILAGFLSTFWNFGYTRTGIKMQAYLLRPQEGMKIKKQQVSAVQRPPLLPLPRIWARWSLTLRTRR